MAWTTPRTWVSGDILTAAQLNTDIRDNANFLYTPPRVSMSRSSAKSIANATTTTYDFDQEDYDTNVMHDNATNNSRSTRKTAGVFLDICAVVWAANVTGRRNSAFLLNGVTGNYSHSQPTDSGSGEAAYIIAQQRAFAVNDYLELTTYQNCGGSLNCTASLTSHWLSN